MNPLEAARVALLEERRSLSLDELTVLAALPASELGELCELAHEVRLARCGDVVEVEGIISAKTGGCPEDCQFCSQSAQFDTPVVATPFLDTAIPMRPSGHRRRPISAPASSASCWRSGDPTSAPWNASWSWCR